MRQWLCCSAVLALMLAGCAGGGAAVVDKPSGKLVHRGTKAVMQTQSGTDPDLATAIAKAKPASRKVLHTISDMMAANEIVVGGCWDYLNEAFNRAGYPQARRKVVFKSKKRGPYADSNQIEVGDWLYYVNHSYNDIEHSGLFIGWTDKSRQEALIFSYAGEKRQNPARMLVYHIDQVYRITRAQD